MHLTNAHSFKHTYNMFFFFFKLATYIVDQKGSLGKKKNPRFENMQSTMNLEIKVQSQLKCPRTFGNQITPLNNSWVWKRL